MSRNALNISFDNLVSEHIAADRLYYQSTTFAKVDKVVSVVLAASGVLLLFSADFHWWSPAPFLLAVLEWFNLLSPRPLLRRYWFMRNPKFLETYNLTFDDSGIRFKTESIDACINWNHYSKLLENDKLCLILYGKGMYTVIPKRAFESTDEIAQFRALVEKHIDPRL